MKERIMQAEKITWNQPFGPVRAYVLAVVALVACFGVPLWRLIQFAWGDDLYSYILLLPFVSGYLIYLKPRRVMAESKPLWGAGAVLLVAGAAVAGAYYLLTGSETHLEIDDYLAANMLAFFLCFLGVSCIFLGRETLRAFAFPIGMLVFMVPMPVALRAGIQTFLQYGSAYAADGMYRLFGMTFYRQDLVFHLKGLNLHVAPECSGIHSSWILMITSLLAGYLFLTSPWRRAALTLAVIPLALLRNGFRIFTLGELCVHVSPKMIDSPIHHQGGPLFFALSLIPFFLLLAWLYRAERPAKPGEPKK